MQVILINPLCIIALDIVRAFTLSEHMSILIIFIET